MSFDIREGPAKYYDYQNFNNSDIPFYKNLVTDQIKKVLELGCGTGRILSELISKVDFIHGIDISKSMIEICHEKLKANNIKKHKYNLSVSDITDFNHKEKYEMIIAPFRVMQNIENDGDVLKLFKNIRNHLSEKGFCVLNVFKPNRDKPTLIKEWCSDKEYPEWERNIGDIKITCSVKKSKINSEIMCIYPELIYRTYKNDKLINQEILNIPMKCYYPDEFINLIQGNGFMILDKWGGYNNETYGEGPELVVKFCTDNNRLQ